MRQTGRKISLVMDLMQVLRQLKTFKKKKKELMVSELTTIAMELEEYEFWNIVEVLAEECSDEIYGVIAKMFCLA